MNAQADFLRLIEINHEVGGVDVKAILENLVGLYREKFGLNNFRMNKIDEFIRGQVTQIPI